MNTYIFIFLTLFLTSCQNSSNLSPTKESIANNTISQNKQACVDAQNEYKKLQKYRDNQ